MTFLLLCLLIFILTAYAVYTGGKTLNDHLVVVFVAGCMFPYVLIGFLSHSFLYLFGLLGIASLFAVLVRKKEASQWMMPFVFLSQPAYAVSFWWYAFIPIHILYAWSFEYPLAPAQEWFIGPFVLGFWGCIWTRYRQQHLSVFSLGDRGIRIVQISDIHASPVMRETELSQLMHQVNAQSPDLVFLTGDLVMPFSEENHEYMLRALSILDAPLYCCMGNHDLPIQATLRQELCTDSWHMLIDEQVKVEVAGTSILIGGLQFHWKNGEKYVESVMKTFSHDADVRIILAHDPRYFHWIPEENVDLVLSGHTHGGQVASNMFGYSWSILRLLGLYDQGWFHKGNCMMYVHKGNWIWGLPPRMGVAPEIALFLL